MEPVVVEIGPVRAHAYSVCMVAAVAVGGWLTYRGGRAADAADFADVNLDMPTQIVPD